MRPAPHSRRSAAGGDAVIRLLARVIARELVVLADALGELNSDRGLWGRISDD
jgi:hypothetical protein